MLCLHANCQSSQVDRNQQKGKKILKAMNNKRTFKYSHYTVSNQSNHFPNFWWWKLSSIFVTYIVGFLRFCFNILVVDAESSNRTGTDIKGVVEVCETLLQMLTSLLTLLTLLMLTLFWLPIVVSGVPAEARRVSNSSTILTWSREVVETVDATKKDKFSEKFQKLTLQILDLLIWYRYISQKDIHDDGKNHKKYPWYWYIS